MADVLAPLGYRPAEGPEGADMVILNTCHIREKATEKVFSELGRLRPLKEARKTAGGDMIIAVAGCVAQAEGEEILARAPYVDMVFGPQTYHELPEMVARAARAGGRVLNTDFPAESKFDTLPEESLSQGPSAFLSVQEGCDKFLHPSASSPTPVAPNPRVPWRRSSRRRAAWSPAGRGRSPCWARTSTRSTAKARTAGTGASTG